MTKPSRETIQKRIATRRRNAALRKRKQQARLHGSMGPEHAAIARLELDGSHSTDALQRRVRTLAHERRIPPADIAKLMYKRISTPDIMVFCKKYKVSYDWLLCGDLRGLLRMVRAAPNQ